MKRKLLSFIWAVLTITCTLYITAPTHAQPFEDGFKNPPREYGVRCWWWWLNSNVTKEAITRDLEAMKSKGFSGAMIFDAGGAEQQGNSRVPDGPTYASPEWRELYKHALAEGKRLGLKLGLSIQSGWNLGGPNVTPDFSAKQITFSETQIDGPVQYDQALPQPPSRFDYYKDICVLAYQNKQADASSLKYSVNASSSQTNHPAAQTIDGNGDTFWVSAGNQVGSGPSKETPQWIEIDFNDEQVITKIIIHAREGYGPKTAQLQFKNKLGAFEAIQDIQCKDAPKTTVSTPTTKTESIRLLITDSYDPRFRDNPRNVQIREIELFGADGKTLLPYSFKKPIRDLQLKSMFHELGGTGPDCRFLLNHEPIVPGEEDAKLDDVINITEYLQADGKLNWSVPDGQWTVLRFGYTPTDAHVSTFSADWHGLVIDYLRKAPLERYWSEVVQQLIDDAGPLAGSTLMQLETDSWECGGMNWTDNFEELFEHYRGYDPVHYLPIFAGKIIEDREVSNRFLADFRKTLGDCVADNHYGHFAELAHERNLQIQPESGGPHAGPLDGIKNLSKNDIVMGEFWAPSPHRPKPNNRFFIKQSSSAAHVYGKKYVGAESFTTIGPHWNDVLWQAQKPSSDHEFCSGLNMVFFHTFTCSPKEMGLPGQEYFAGTHINPQVTWWDYSDGYINYLNRCQYMLQQGTFVADVLYYYGDHIP
ncbi:discoidin domain-containing protein, partial [bacterium]|nr:discoidin domain-containing protein [bacterium]